MTAGYAIIRSEIKIALHKLGVSKKAHIGYEPNAYRDHIKVTVDGEYYGVWDAVRKTFVD